MLGALALITFKQWRLHRLRLFLTVFGIALGVAVYFAVQTSNATLVDSLHATINKLAGKANLQLLAGEAGFSQNVLPQVRQIKGVKIAEPVTETIVSTDLPEGEKLLILGLDTSSDLQLYDEMFDESGVDIKNPLVFSSRADSIAVTRDFAERFNLKENDKITIETQSGKQQFTIRGFFKTAGAGAVFNGNVAAIDISTAQDAFNRGQKIDRIDIMIAPDANVENVQQALRKILPSGVDVARPELRGQGLENAVTSMRVSLTIMSFLALSIGIFIIFNSFSVSLNQRWKEIGILRAVGVERRNVQKMFLGEAILVGLTGSALGVLAGFYLAFFAGRVMTAVSSSVYGYVSSPQPPEFNFLYALLAFAIGVASSIIAAYLPARAASRLNPVLALHNIETRQRENDGGKARIAAGIILIFAGLTLTRFTTPTVGLISQFLYLFLMLFGMVLLLPKFIQIGALILRPLMNFLFGVEGLIAVETMRRSPRRTSSTVGAIMIGLALVFSIGAFIQSQKTALDRSLDKSFSADVLVTSSEQLHSRTYHFNENIADRIASLPEVEIADRMRTTAVNYENEEVALLAHDMNAYFQISPDLLDEGNADVARELTAAGKGVLISNNFSLRWHIRVGDTLELQTPSGTLLLPVVGSLEYYRSEKGTIFLDREVYKRYWQDTDVDYILMNLKPGVDRSEFKNKVYSSIPVGEKAFFYTHDEYKQWATRLIDQFFTLTYLQMVIAVIVAAIGLMNTMVISVAERRREIAVLRALGGFRQQILKMILLEAITISLIGLAAGIVAGLLDAYFLIQTAVKVVAGFNLPFKFPLLMIALALPLVILVALISAWLPARRAANLNVIESLGYE